MSRSLRSPRPAQLRLFQPTLKLPHWSALPEEVRQQTRRLLAQLLRDAVRAPRAVTPSAEVSDE
jgi:hypothetical protein